MRIAVGQGKSGVNDVGGFVLPDQAGDQIHQPETVVEQHDPLGIAGGSGGVDNLIGVAHIHDFLGNDLPGVFVDNFVQRKIFGRHRNVLLLAVSHTDEFDMRHVVKNFFQLRQAFAGNHNGLGLGIVQNIAQPVTPGPRVNQNRYGTDSRPPEHAVDEFGVIAHENGEGVTLFDSVFKEQPGKFIGIRVDVLIGQDVFAQFSFFEYQDFLIRLFMGLDFDQVGPDGLI